MYHMCGWSEYLHHHLVYYTSWPLRIVGHRIPTGPLPLHMENSMSKNVWERRPSPLQARRMHMAFDTCVQAGYPQHAVHYAVHWVEYLATNSIAYAIRDSYDPPTFPTRYLRGDVAIPHLLKQNLACLINHRWKWCTRKSSVAKRAKLLTMFLRHLHLLLPMIDLHQFVEGMWMECTDTTSDSVDGSATTRVWKEWYSKGEGQHAPIGVICDWLEDNSREQEGIALRVLEQLPTPPIMVEP